MDRLSNNALLHEIHAMVREQKVEIAHIKVQTTKHNGRMSKVEGRVDNLDIFKTRAMVIWGGVIAVVTYVANKVI